MVSLDPWVCLLGALLVLTLPLRWLLASVSAAAFHELCHYLAIRAVGGRVHRLTISPAGAVMDTEIPGRGRELLAALAGPAGSFLLAGLFRTAPHIALCAMAQGLFNLLPLYPLDGGRVLRCTLEGRLSERKLAFLEGSLAVLAALAALRVSALLAAAVALRAFFGKIPCKPAAFGVQ